MMNFLKTLKTRIIPVVTFNSDENSTLLSCLEHIN